MDAALIAMFDKAEEREGKREDDEWNESGNCAHAHVISIARAVVEVVQEKLLTVTLVTVTQYRASWIQ